jgi:hypothetical protein
VRLEAPTNAEHGSSIGAHFREVNSRIRELAGRFGGDEPAMFVCECDDSGCFAQIPLRVSEYDAAVGADAWLLAHDPNGLAASPRA